MNTTYWLNEAMRRLYTKPCEDGTSEFWIGLLSTEPNRDGGNVTEPSASSYARVQITEFTEPSAGIVRNATALSFPRSAETWFDAEIGKAIYWGLFDGSGQDANILSCGALDSPKTIESNTVVTIDAGTLCITLTDYEPAELPPAGT